jgi:hypothetical protein
MKMSEDDLLAILQQKEEESSTYVNGQLASDRERSMREYNREPLGNEQEGWSEIVSSDTQDTIEWILPSLLKIFSSTDEAVSFEPTGAEDVKSAQEATDACNYVFYKQNNGFMIMYTALKDALISKNCAVMWRKHEQKVPKTQVYKGLTEEQLAYIMQQNESAEIVQASQEPSIDPMTGQPVMLISAKIKTIETKTTVKVEAFPPEDLLIERNWNTPLLIDCPYVARNMRVTLSDVHEMGYTDTKVEDMGTGVDKISSVDAEYRANRSSDTADTYNSTTDDSMIEGILRIEFVLVDFDGDGIAERRCIYRLKDKILKNEEVDSVQIATSSPILNTHRWDGMSMAECVADLMQLKTEIMRQTLNSLYLANNPRTKVLTDSNWSPMANLDDLLDSRPGGIIRQRDPNAVMEHITPFVGGQSFQMLEYIDGMRENRTGVTRYNQGIDANSLNKTATGISAIMNASQQRIELMARIFAETLVKPIMSGILHLLTQGGMDKLSFKLRNEYVQIDPNEWSNQYDITINVGLGTGDKQQQGQHLQMIFQNQMNLMGMGLTTPQEIYHTQAKITENAGFKNVGDFFIDPSTKPPAPPPPPPPPPPEVVKTQMQIQADQQKFQMQSQQDQQSEMSKAQFDAQQAQNDQAFEMQKLQMQIQADRENAEMQAQIQLQEKQMELESEERIALLNAQAVQINNQSLGAKVVDTDENEEEQPDGMALIAQSMAMLAQSLSQPKQVIRDTNGKIIGVQ